MGPLAQQRRLDFGGSKGGRGVGGEVRVTHACGENHYPALLEVPDGPAPDVGLGHFSHLDGRQDPGGLAVLLERVLEGKGVDHRPEHPHGVRRRPVHAGPGAGRPSVRCCPHRP